MPGRIVQKDSNVKAGSVEELDSILSSVKAYLEDLHDSGTDELPLAATPLVSAAERDMLLAPVPENIEKSGFCDSLESIRMDLGDCRRCALGDDRKNIVFGVGNPDARVVFVGEGPGRDEDLQKEPFVGEAGKLLTKIIEAMGFSRSDVYICNVVKCRPPQNRDPLPGEISVCAPFMLRQVLSINPDVVVALGKFSAQTLLGVKTPISRLRGSFQDYHGIPLMPTYHPAALLRDQSLKRDVWEDMKQVLKKLGLTKPQEKTGSTLNPSSP